MKILLVLLTILKGFGIFLLAVILLLLLILFLLLFTPIGYGATGGKNEKLKGSFFVTWVFGLLHMAGVYEEGGEISFSAKICGFSLFGEAAEQRREKKKKKRRDKKRRKAQKKQKARKAEEVVLSAREKEVLTGTDGLPFQSILEKEKEEEIEKMEQPMEGVIEEQTPEIPEEKQEPQEKVEPKGKGTSPSAMGKQQGVIRRVKMVDIQEVPPAEKVSWEEEMESSAEDFSEEIGNEEKGEKEKWKQYYHLFQGIQNKKQILKAIFRFVKRVCKNILPKDLWMKATIGTGDPALTGQLLGAVGIAKGKFGKHLQVKGDFAKADLRDMEMRLKGRIYVGSLVVGLVQLVLTKPVWALIKQYRKGNR